MLPAEKRPPTAGRKPVSFGLAAPGWGRFNSDGAASPPTNEPAPAWAMGTAVGAAITDDT